MNCALAGNILSQKINKSVKVNIIHPFSLRFIRNVHFTGVEVKLEPIVYVEKPITPRNSPGNPPIAQKAEPKMLLWFPFNLSFSRQPLAFAQIIAGISIRLNHKNNLPLASKERTLKPG